MGKEERMSLRRVLFLSCLILSLSTTTLANESHRASIFGSLFGGLSSAKKKAIIAYAEAHAESMSPALASNHYHEVKECELLEANEGESKLVQVSLGYYNSPSALLPMYDYEIVVETNGKYQCEKVQSIDGKHIDWPSREKVTLDEEQRAACLEFALAIAETDSPAVASGHYVLVAGCALDLSCEEDVVKATVEYYNGKAGGKKALLPMYDFDMRIELADDGSPRRVLRLDDKEIDWPIRKVKRIKGEEARAIVDYARACALSKDPELDSGEYLEIAGAAFDYSQEDTSLVKVELEYYNHKPGGKKPLLPMYDYEMVLKVDGEGKPTGILTIDGEAVSGGQITMLKEAQKSAIMEFARAHAECLEPNVRATRIFKFVGGCAFDIENDDRTRIPCVLEYYRHKPGGKKALLPYHDFKIIVALDENFKPTKVLSIDDKPCDFPNREVRRLSESENSQIVDFARQHVAKENPSVNDYGLTLVAGAAIDLETVEKSVAIVHLEWFRRGEDGKLKLFAYHDYSVKVELDDNRQPVQVIAE